VALADTAVNLCGSGFASSRTSLRQGTLVWVKGKSPPLIPPVNRGMIPPSLLAGRAGVGVSSSALSKPSLLPD